MSDKARLSATRGQCVAVRLVDAAHVAEVRRCHQEVAAGGQHVIGGRLQRRAYGDLDPLDVRVAGPLEQRLEQVLHGPGQGSGAPPAAGPSAALASDPATAGDRPAGSRTTAVTGPRGSATYASASAADPIERGMRIALRTFRARVVAVRPLSDIEMTKSDTRSLSEAWIGSPAERRRTVDRRREQVVTGGVQDDADRRRRHRRRDRSRRRTRAGRWRSSRCHRGDPRSRPGRGRKSVPRRRSPCARRSPRPGSRRRVAGPDRVEDERLRLVVRLGHDVAGALVVDPLEPLVAIHQDPAGLFGEIRGERELLVEPGRHGALHETSSGPGSVPRTVTVLVNVTALAGLDARAQQEGRLATARDPRDR